MYLGDYKEDEVVHFTFTTSNSSGSAVDPSDDFEAADFLIFKDNGTGSIKATANGITVISSFNAEVGVHTVTIDTSVDTGDSGFWERGADYSVVLSPDTETVGGVGVRYPWMFSIENRVAASLGVQSKLDVNAEADTALADYDAPTKTEMDTALAKLLLWPVHEDTIDTRIDDDEFIMTGGSDLNDMYNGMICVIESAADPDAFCARVVSDYTGSTNTVLLNQSANFTIAANDVVRIYYPTAANVSRWLDIVPLALSSQRVQSLDTNSASVLANTATLLSRLGSPSDLGSGASLAANLLDMLGAAWSGTDDTLEHISTIVTALTATSSNFSTLFSRLGVPNNLGGGANLSQNLLDMAGTGFDYTNDTLQKIRDNLGGSGLTAQQVRDAMKLAPSAGTADSESIDQLLSLLKQQPTNWYADSAATGDNDGTSLDNAWSTLADVDISLMKPGDRLFLYGTFTGDRLLINNKVGITVYAYGAIIDGTGNLNNHNIYINNSPNTRWFGGEIRNATGNGSNAYGVLCQNSDGLHLKDIWTHDNSYCGIQVNSCRDAIIEYCHCKDENHLGISVANDSATGTDYYNANIKIRYNKCWNGNFIGILVGGANGKENLRGIEVYGNEVWHNGIGMRIESGYYVKLYQNTFWENDNPNADAGATETELEIEDGDSCEIFENWFTGKQATGYVINFIANVGLPNRHKIYRNHIYNNFAGNVGIRLAVNGTTGLEITNNVIVTDGTGTSSRGMTICQATSGVIAGNKIIGGGYGIYLNPVATVAITAADWAVTNNTFDGQGTRAIHTATTANTDVTLSGNRYVNQPLAGWVAVRLSGTVTYYGVYNGTTVNAITDKDATARTDAPNYRGPTTGTFKGRDYTILQLPSDVVGFVGTGFDEETDSLVKLRARVDELAGTAWNTNDSLEQISAKAENIQGRIPAALSSGNMVCDVKAINASTNAAIRHALAAQRIVPFTVSDTNLTPTTTQFDASDITEATADHYNGRIILWTSGNLVDQVTDVTDYALSSGQGRFTVTALTEAPANGDTGILI